MFYFNMEPRLKWNKIVLAAKIILFHSKWNKIILAANIMYFILDVVPC